MRRSRPDHEAKEQVEGSIQRAIRVEELLAFRAGGRAAPDREPRARSVLAVQRSAGNQAAVQRMGLSDR